ncbi:hypothetical protein BDV30DRAFT_39310 [Aspergillus minisclerotigenes]|uniref:Zn(2)-C6 fungal-type domain-containing protein n=1 Tax=Aspergillus minisclerotigenes TaxID=656917 RepID=A0A5N6JEQ7_9EURO|nr:hypothetical protein BDV30DRAFT_39310 [Aspergillus minisclerotigenes]
MGGSRKSASCLICRRRKIKCDRSEGFCNNCRNLGEQCVYSTEAGTDTNVTDEGPTSSDAVTQAGLKRRRVLRSCLECKRTKSKCSGGSACTRCTKKGLHCSFHEEEPNPREETHVQGSSQAIPTWLVMRNLPPIDRVRELIDIYFAQIHTVRCMGFLHIPTFMERFKDKKTILTEMSGLIYVMCALAAPFYCARVIASKEDGPSSAVLYFDAGRGWAEAAMQCLFSSFGSPRIECIITAVLLHEYYLRVGDYAKGFLISGFIARHVQLLQLNMEYDDDILCRKSKMSWAAKETRRRVLWACYLLDASIECGINQLCLISSSDIYVQLPCSEDLFVRNIPCNTEMLIRGKLLPFADAAVVGAAGNLDIRAYYIRAMAIRSKILKYVKHLEGEIPWEVTETSQFHKLDNEIRELDASIPDSLKMSAENIYIFKASGRLNLFFGVHILIAQTFNDLYRVGVSRLVFPNTATKWIRENAPAEFIKLCHRTCISKAAYIGSLLQDLWNCHKLSIVDLPYAVHTQICSSVLVTSLSSWREPEPPLPHISHSDYKDILQTNVTILKYLQRYIKADLYYESATQALKHFNTRFSNETPERRATSSIRETSPIESNDHNRPSQSSLEHILNPLGTYPMARKQVQHYDQQHARDGTSDKPSVPQSDIAAFCPSTADNPANMDGFLGFQDQSFFSQFPDWAPDIPIISDMGYPTFLDQYPVSIADGGLVI